MEAYGNELNMTSPFPTHMAKGQIIVRKSLHSLFITYLAPSVQLWSSKIYMKNTNHCLVWKLENKDQQMLRWAWCTQSRASFFAFRSFHTPSYLSACLCTHAYTYLYTHLYVYTPKHLDAPIYTIFLHPKSPKVTAFVCEKMGLLKIDDFRLIFGFFSPS